MAAFLRRYPAAWLAAAWLGGLVAARFWEVEVKFLLVLGALAWGIAWTVYRLAYRRFSWDIGVMPPLLTGVFLTGWAYGLLRQISASSGDASAPDKAVVEVAFRLEKELRPTRTYRRFYARAREINGRPSDMGLAVRIPKDSAFSPDFEAVYVYHPRPGDWQALPPAAHPYAFDYGGYLKSKGMERRLRVKNPSLLNLRSREGARIFSSLRRKIRSTLARTVRDTLHFQLLTALLLGERQWLDPDLKKAFTRAGVMHVLAISGLHIGILLFFLRAVFSPLKRRKWLYNLAVLSLLWGYAALTGFSPSVVRAVVMFTLFQLAWELEREVSSAYVLLLAAWLILIWSPAWIADTGFLLSFTAVASILAFYPLLRKWWYPRGRAARYVIDLIYVSVAAQLGLWPLLLLFFHRLSFGFLLANVAVIPLITLVLVIGFALLPLWAAGVKAEWAVRILEKLLDFTLAVIRRLADMDFLVLDRIYFSPLLAAGAFALMWGVKKWWESGRGKYVLLGIWVASAAFLIDYTLRHRASGVWLTSAGYRPVLVVREGTAARWYGPEELSEYFLQSWYHTGGTRLRRADTLPGVFRAGNRTYLVLSRSLADTLWEGRADALILTGSPKIHLDKWIARTGAKQIFVMPDNYRYLRRLWEATARRRGVSYVDLSNGGYAELDRNP
ncbi:MAG: ComEC family competence protein [Chlorobi bacterium]|nr:ComEC family competence protein [Chlorobiota bacterium]